MLRRCSVWGLRHVTVNQKYILSLAQIVPSL